jgi:hypothetical protein
LYEKLFNFQKKIKMEVVKVNVKDENESYLFLVNDLDCLKKQGLCILKYEYIFVLN